MVSRAKRPKFNFEAVDSDKVFRELWADDMNYSHERLRIQHHFLRLLYTIAGARRNAFFTGGLRYQVQLDVLPSIRSCQLTHIGLRARPKTP